MIRYLGGFLAAYDLSGDRRLLDKSLELADMLVSFHFKTHRRLFAYAASSTLLSIHQTVCR